MKPFESFLAPQLYEFLVYRENLGYATDPVRANLKAFDRYLKTHKPDRALLTPSFFLELRAQLTFESRSINRILSSLRRFFQYLIRRGLYTENPLQDVPPLPENALVPFVFSSAETTMLLGAVGKRVRKSPDRFLIDLALYLAIVLLARCGMRIKEPLRLVRSQYRSRERTLYIAKTKFKKDRLIPIPKAVASEIDNYLAVRSALLCDDRNPYLLAGKEHKALRDDQVRSVFHQAVKDIGLRRPRQVIGTTNFSAPTPHSLRHSFAVNTLKRVKERGGSAQNALPVLATYMGHSDYKHTIKYLTVLDAKHRQGLLDVVLSHQEKP